MKLLRVDSMPMRSYMYLPRELLDLKILNFLKYRMHKNIFLNYFQNNVKIGVTGVTGLQNPYPASKTGYTMV